MTGAERRRIPWALILLLASFLVPAAVAWTLFFSGWTPPGTGNHGDLVQPPHHLEGELRTVAGEPVTNSDLRGHWTMLVLSDGPCAETCAERLDQTRRVRLALAQNADRVRRVLVLPPEAPLPADTLLEAHGDLTIYHGRGLLPEDTGAASDNGLHVSVLDTRAYRMMAYPEPLDAGGLLQDLKHLLRLSNVDLERLQGLSEDD